MKILNKLPIIISILSLFTFFVPANADIKVVASIKPIHSLASYLMNGVAKPDLIVDGYASPHGFAMKPSHAKMLQNADLIFWVGEDVENFLEKPLGSIAKKAEKIELMQIKGLQVLKFRERNIFDDHDDHGHDDHDKKEDHDSNAKKEDHDDHGKKEDHDDHERHAHGEFDPHIWLDPILVKQQVNVIRDGLIQVDPDNKEHYEENARIYNDKLDALDMKIGSALSSCQKDTIVPYHNAFTYLGERYDIHIMALGGMAPDSEASAAEIAEFVDFVKDNDIKVIFSEELVDPRLAEVIADEANARVMLFSPLEALSQEEARSNVSYIDKMEENLDSLKVALECQ